MKLTVYKRRLRLWGLRLAWLVPAIATSNLLAVFAVAQAQEQGSPQGQASVQAVSRQVDSAQSRGLSDLLFAQSEASPSDSGLVQITGIRLQEAEDALQVVIEASDSSSPQIFQTRTENTLVVDIEGAQLALPGESAFSVANPSAEISAISAVQLNENTVQITVEAASLETDLGAFLVRGDRALTLDVVASDPVADAPEQPEDTEDAAEAADDDGRLRLIVTGALPGSDYSVPSASVGTRTDTPIIDVPQSIQVIPQEVLEDQGARTLNDALRNASGVSIGRAISGTRSSTPLIRGFESNNNILRNGIRDDTLQFGTTIPNVEQVEILKGPASVLFGAGDLGGTINLVTESPLYEPRYEIEFKGGSFEEYGVQLDLAGPLDDEENLAYRLNIAYEGEGSFVDFQDSDFFFVAPSLQLINTDRTSLIFDFEYLRNRTRQTSAGLPAVSAIGLENNTLVEDLVAGGLVISEEDRQLAGTLDISSNLGEPTLARGLVNITRVGYRLNHELSDTWELNHDFLASFQETPEESFVVGTGFTQIAGQPDFGLLDRVFIDNPSSRESIIFNANVVGEFDVLGIDQTLLLGSEVSFEEERDTVIQRLPSPFLSFNPPTPSDPFSIFSPNYSPEVFFNDLNRERLGTDSLANRNRYSLYGQTQINLFSERLIALIGGRLDFVDQDFRDAANLANPDPIEQNETAFSPRVGLVYKPIENMSLYASYSESFNPVIGQSFEDEVFESERGRQFETGIKATFFNERLSTTLAYYNLVRSNVLTQDPERDGFQVQIGEQRSRGIELDIAGEILPGWNIIANYANTDAIVTDDNEIDVGTRLLNSPRNSASLWTTYQLQSGALEGLGFGVGVLFVGDRNGELRRPFELPSYTRTDASIFYERGAFRTQVNFENLFDVRYFESARDQFRVAPGAPFGVSASVNWVF